MKHPLQNSKIRRKYHKAYIKRFDKQEKHFISLIRKFFKGQKKRLLDNYKERYLKSIINEILNIELEIKLAKETLLPYLEKVLREAGEETIDFVGYDYRFVFTSAISETLEQRADLFSESINKTTIKQLKNVFEESAENGENFEQLSERISEKYKQISKGRALNIARTEIQVANQVGVLNGYKQAQIPIKIWVAVMDDRTRDTHAMLDGEEKPMEVPFSNGLMMPGDPIGPVEEVVNCRCSI